MREGDFNKVIHTVGVLCANDFQIKDLAVLYKAQRKVARWRENLAGRPSVRSAVSSDYPALLRGFIDRRRSYLSQLQARLAA